MPTISNIIADVRKQLDEIQVNASGFLQGSDNEDLDVIIKSHIYDAIRFVYERADMQYMHPTNFVETGNGMTISSIRENIKPRPESFYVGTFALPDSFVRLYSAKAQSWGRNITECIDWNNSNYSKLWNLYTTGYPDKPVAAIVPNNSIVLNVDVEVDYIFVKTSGSTPTIPDPTAAGQTYILFDNSIVGSPSLKVYESTEIHPTIFRWYEDSSRSAEIYLGIYNGTLTLFHALKQNLYKDITLNQYVFVILDHTIAYNDYTRSMLLFSLESPTESAFAYYVSVPTIDLRTDTNTIDIIEKVYSAVISQLAGLTLLTIRDEYADTLFNLALSQMGAKIKEENG